MISYSWSCITIYARLLSRFFVLTYREHQRAAPTQTKYVVTESLLIKGERVFAFTLFVRGPKNLYIFITYMVIYQAKQGDVTSMEHLNKDQNLL